MVEINSGNNEIVFTLEKLKQLKKAYNECKGDTFTFEGNPLHKPYAKYLIEYLEGEFLKRGEK